jgi:hypothetical protein
MGVQKTIYISDNLDRKLRKHPHISWSEVACGAFKLKLAELANQKKGDLSMMRARLSRERSSRPKMLVSGRTRGRSWAADDASAEQLASLDAAYTPGELALIHNSYCPAERFFFLITPGLDGSRSAARDFWSDLLPGVRVYEIPIAFVLEFAEEARSTWLQVKDQLEAGDPDERCVDTEHTQNPV